MGEWTEGMEKALLDDVQRKMDKLMERLRDELEGFLREGITELVIYPNGEISAGSWQQGHDDAPPFPLPLTMPRGYVDPQRIGGFEPAKTPEDVRRAIEEIVEEWEPSIYSWVLGRDYQPA